MKILITGGAGFIGSHIQDAYINEGYEVAVIDNLITGKKENLHPKAKFYQIDIQSPELKEVLKEFRPDIVNHHAAQMNLRKSVLNPHFDAEVNVLGLINVLQACHENKVKKMIFASTGGAIYGEQNYFPADEKHSLEPTSPYGLTKMIGEEYLKLFERLYKIPFVALRYTNVYGPRQNPDGEVGVIAIFSSKMLNEELPMIHGDGSQTRDYIFIQDVVKANLLALGDEVKGIYNIGTGIETDVNSLFKRLAQQSGADKAIHGMAKIGEQKRSVISYEFAKKSFGWSPKISLEEGLQKTFDWFRENSKKQTKKVESA